MLISLRSFLKLLLALSIFLASTVWWMQEDPWFIHACERHIAHAMQRYIGGRGMCTIKVLNLFSGYILFDYCELSSPTQDWSITCPATVLSISWKNLLLNGLLRASITFYNPVITSTYIFDHQEQLALLKPYKQYMSMPSQLLLLDSIVLRHAQVEVQEPSGAKACLGASADISFREHGYALFLSVLHGSLAWKHGILLPEVTGSAKIFIANDGTLKTSHGQGVAKLPNLGGKNPIIVSWDHIKTRLSAKGFFSMYTPDRLTTLKGGYKKAKDGNWHIGCSMKSPISLNCGMPVNAALHSEVRAKYGAGLKYQFTTELDHITTGMMQLGDCFIKGQGGEHSIAGNFKLHLRMPQVQSLVLPGTWRINTSAKQLDINVIHNDTNAVQISYKNDIAQAHYDVMYKQNKHHGTVTYNAGQATRQIPAQSIVAQGTVDQYRYIAAYNIPTNMLTRLELTQDADKQKTHKLIDLSLNKNLLTGMTHWYFIKHLLAHYTGLQLYGGGYINCGIRPFDSAFRGKFKLCNGSIRFPFLYNMIRSGEALISVNTAHNQLLLHNVSLGFHRGSCYSSLMTFGWSSNGQLFVHIPCVFNQCFINWQKNFFGLFSGELTLYTGLTDNKNNLRCSGDITMTQSQLTANLLSYNFQQRITPNMLLRSFVQTDRDIGLDVRLKTKEPLIVKTDFLTASASAQVQLQGSAYNPQATGIIELLQGSLNFPYQKLFITSGKLILHGTQGDKPDISIELIAKNTIKKYPIVMTVRGTLLEPSVKFEAPGLTEEQIITLLLTGSEDGSLYWAMPRMAMQYLQTLIFGSTDDKVGVRSLKRFFANLQKVRLVPHVGHEQHQEQSRVAGAVEVDLTDRLRAKVQNDISLSKDTSVEIEYTLSDEMSVRAIRDPHDGIGGEITMHWKLP